MKEEDGMYENKLKEIDQSGNEYTYSTCSQGIQLTAIQNILTYSQSIDLIFCGHFLEGLHWLLCIQC